MVTICLKCTLLYALQETTMMNDESELGGDTDKKLYQFSKREKVFTRYFNTHKTVSEGKHK